MEKANIGILVQKAQSGDMEAMESLLRLAHTPVSYQCRKIMAHGEDAEDMTQEVLLKIYNSIGSLKEPEKFTSWAGSIAARHCINERRRNPKDLQFAEDEEGHSFLDYIEELDQQKVPDAAMDNAETRRMITELIDALPEAQRVCTYLFYYDQMSVKEIAEVLGVSENTVKSRLNYARKAIKEGVEDYEKKGVKLYGLSPLPFLLYFLRASAESGADTAAAGAMAKAAVAAGSAAGSAPGGAVAAASGAAAKGAAGIFGSLTVKVAAGVLAGAVAIGGVGAVVVHQVRQEDEEDTRWEERLDDEEEEEEADRTSGEETDRETGGPAGGTAAIAAYTTRKTTVDTGGHHAEIYLETPQFDPVNKGYRKINEFFDEMHAGFSTGGDASVTEMLELCVNATASDVYLYTTTSRVISQDERFVSIALNRQWYSGRSYFPTMQYYTFLVQTGQQLTLADLTGGTEEENLTLLINAIKESEYGHLLQESYNAPTDTEEFFVRDGQIWFIWHVDGRRGSEVEIPVLTV